MLKRLWLRLRPMKTMSLDGRYFYINGRLALDARGWLIQDVKAEQQHWLPFVFWKVKRGETLRATTDDVRRYTLMRDWLVR